MNKPLNPSPSWTALQDEARSLSQVHLRQLFAADSERVTTMSMQVGELVADYSKQRLNSRALQLLRNLAEERGLAAQIARLFAGEAVNTTENRPALHMALRAATGERYSQGGRDLVPEVQAERVKLRAFCEGVASGSCCSMEGDRFTDVVNLGIGGSDLGPRMAEQALAAYALPGLQVHFVSNVDGADLGLLLRRLNPDRTLFIVASKTFTTQETMSNAESAVDWLWAAHPEAGRDALLEHHFVAVTANVKAARVFGLPKGNVFAFWDWVGGRYSLWSSVGLGLALAVGMDKFEAMLEGAREMDHHFRDAPLADNLPATLALIDVWNSNFLGAETHAIIPYASSLHLLPAYLQQLEMESNGKSVDREGGPLSCSTAPIIWGSAGTDAQHSYFQLLHQGGRLVPIDFIAFAQSDCPLGDHHPMLLANCFAQSEALMVGRTEAEARNELEAAGTDAATLTRLLPHKVFAGNQPSTTLLAPLLSPRTLGMLIALYEHKVFVAASIWGLNPYDQFGVELGKQMANTLLPALTQAVPGTDFAMSGSTRFLIDYYQRNKAAPA